MRINKPKVTHRRVVELLAYNPKTGVFTWKQDRKGRAKQGSIAGAVHAKGYIHIMVDKERIAAHRLAWFYMTGKWPVYLIDHKSGDCTDNSFSNLREATAMQNQHNRTKARGYIYNKKTGKWVASIRINYKAIYLGSFDLESDARAAYIAACKKRERQYK